MQTEMKLIFLDLDGTLLTEEMKITEETKRVFRLASEKGVQFIAATGRPYSGLPMEALCELGIQYAVTGNGAAIYKIPEYECIYEDCLEWSLAADLYRLFIEKDIHTDVFLAGKGYTSYQSYEQLERLKKPERLTQYFRKSRIRVEDPEQLIRERKRGVEKINLNFYPEPDGTYKSYEWGITYLNAREDLNAVTGGGHNMEVSNRTATKGNALRYMAKRFGVSVEATMAFGDSQNDISMIEAAGIGVAMGNATADVKEAANYVTKTNDENGVAYAIEKILSL